MDPHGIVIEKLFRYISASAERRDRRPARCIVRAWNYSAVREQEQLYIARDRFRRLSKLNDGDNFIKAQTRSARRTVSMIVASPGGEVENALCRRDRSTPSSRSDCVSELLGFLQHHPSLAPEPETDNQGWPLGRLPGHVHERHVDLREAVREFESVERLQIVRDRSVPFDEGLGRHDLIRDDDAIAQDAVRFDLRLLP